MCLNLEVALRLCRMKTGALNMPKLDNPTVKALRQFFHLELMCMLKDSCNETG